MEHFKSFPACVSHTDCTRATSEKISTESQYSTNKHEVTGGPVPGTLPRHARAHQVACSHTCAHVAMSHPARSHVRSCDFTLGTAERLFLAPLAHP